MIFTIPNWLFVGSLLLNIHSLLAIATTHNTMLSTVGGAHLFYNSTHIKLFIPRSLFCVTFCSDICTLVSYVSMHYISRNKAQ